jgi:hypothetical protein
MEKRSADDSEEYQFQDCGFYQPNTTRLARKLTISTNERQERPRLPDPFLILPQQVFRGVSTGK